MGYMGVPANDGTAATVGVDTAYQNFTHALGNAQSEGPLGYHPNPSIMHGLIVSDVSTLEAVTQALSDKKAEKVSIIPNLVEGIQCPGRGCRTLHSAQSEGPLG